MVKLGFTVVFIIFLFVQNIDFGYSLEPPRIIYVLSRNLKNIRIFICKISFLVVKFTIYLKRHVFVMLTTMFDYFLVINLLVSMIRKYFSSFKDNIYTSASSTINLC